MELVAKRAGQIGSAASCGAARRELVGLQFAQKLAQLAGKTDHARSPENLEFSRRFWSRARSTMTRLLFKSSGVAVELQEDEFREPLKDRMCSRVTGRPDRPTTAAPTEKSLAWGKKMSGGPRDRRSSARIPARQ